MEINGEIPESLLSCNCSICRRYGSLLAYYPSSKVKVLAPPDSTDEYAWGEKNLALVRCRNCGCFSHWRLLESIQADRMGVNARLFTNVDISGIRIRHFDGANTWKYLD